MTRQKPKVLLAHWDGFEVFDDRAKERIREVATLLDPAPVTDWNDPRCDGLLAEVDVILGHWGCPHIDEGVLKRAPNLGMVAYAAGTLKNVIGDAVWDRAIRVTSGANANAEPVAEFTIAAILFANKEVFWRTGNWDIFAATDAMAVTGTDRVGNYDKTIGIVSASLVGRRTMQLLEAFPALNVTLYDPFVSAEEADAMGATKMDLLDVCKGCDILSIHAPALPETRHLIGRAELAALRDGATVINTARGWVLDQDALINELRAGRLRAVLDVTEPEPLPDDSPLLELPNVVLTPHISGSQGTEINRMTDYVIEEIRRWSAGEPALNEITKERLGRLA